MRPLLPLCATMALVAGEPATLPKAVPADLESVVYLDYERVLAEGQKASLLGMFFDPRAAETLAHVKYQMGLMQDGEREMPPFVDWMTSSKQHLFFADHPTKGSDERRYRVPSLAYLSNMGPALAPTSEWFQNAARPDDDDALTIGAFSGWGEDEVFFGTSGEILAIAEPQFFEAYTKKSADVAIRESIGSFTWDAKNYMRLMDESSRYDDDPRMLMWSLPAVSGDKVGAVGDLTFEDGDWKGTIAIEGLDFASWTPLSAGFMGRLPETGDVQLALGMNPALALRVFALGAMRRQIKRIDDPVEFDQAFSRQLEEALGMDGQTLQSALTGEVLMHVHWGGMANPIPQMGLAMGLKDSAAIVKAISGIAEEVGLKPQDGQENEWVMALPIGLLNLAVVDGALVASNHPQVFTALKTEKEGSAGVGQVVYSRMALKNIGQAWLPMAMAMMQGVNETMGRSPTNGLRNQLWNISQNLEKGTTPSELLLGIRAEGNEDRNDWATREMGRFFAVEGDVRPAVDAGLIVYGEKPDVPEGIEQPQDTRQMINEFVIVFRSEKGWHIVDDNWSSSVPKAMSAEALSGKLSNYIKLAGPEPTALAAVTLPEVATFSAKWFPPVPVMLDHLPAVYAIDGTFDEGTFTLVEKGLPLGMVSTGMLTVMSPIISGFIERDIQRRKERAIMETLRKEHGAVVEVFDAVARVHREMVQQGQKPTKASDYVTDGGLDLASTAPLFGGEVPTDATWLDQVGVFHTELDENDWQAVVWEVRVTDEYQMQFTQWGGRTEVKPAREGVPMMPGKAVKVEPKPLF